MTRHQDADIQALVDNFKENDQDMLIAVYLAAHGTLRRSEVCGLKVGDIRDGVDISGMHWFRPTKMSLWKREPNLTRGSDGTLQRIYRNSIDEYTGKFNKRLLDHFQSMQDDMQDEN